MSPPSRHIIVFGRYPVPDRTKTRLIPVLGALGAAELQRRLTEQTLRSAGRVAGASVLFCHAGGSPRRVRRWLGPRIDSRPQTGGHLGERMQAALESVLEQGGRKVVLVGTDVPDLTPDILDRALRALDTHDVVLGPSSDGGYWLVGLRRRAALFSGIDWGTSRVLAQTLDAARHGGLSVFQLPVLKDIDTPEDLADWQACAQLSGPYLSVIVPTLNEGGRIAAALDGISGRDVETIVVDGGSGDDTVRQARQAGARVIASARGRAVQQNAGAAAARGGVLLFLHADTRLPPEFGAQVFEVLLDKRVALGAFRFKTDWNHAGMRLVEKMVHARGRLFQLPYGDQAFFLRRGTFERAGGFPEVAIAEDLLLARRVCRLGSVALARAQAVTSGRRWRALGIWRTTLVNYLIAAGCLIGVAPERLAPLYRMGIAAPVSKRGLHA